MRSSIRKVYNIPEGDDSSLVKLAFMLVLVSYCLVVAIRHDSDNVRFLDLLTEIMKMMGREEVSNGAQFLLGSIPPTEDLAQIPLFDFFVTSYVKCISFLYL